MLAWAALLTALAVMLALWTGDLVAIVLLPGAVLVVLCVALAAVRARDPQERLVSEASASAVLGACGLAALAIGAAAGLWAALIGVVLLVVAVVVAVRERWG
jgi:hypothetical protein